MAITANPPNWTEDGTLILGGSIVSNGELIVQINPGSTVVDEGAVLIADPDRPNTINASAVSADVIDLTKFQVTIVVNDTASDNMTFTGSTSLRNRLLGGSGADSLTGGDENDQLDGGGNGDTLSGGGGNDNLLGNSGNDTINGGAGADTLSGGNNDDTFDYVAAADIVAGETVNGGANTDTLRFSPTGTFNFRLATLTSIERLEFNNTGVGAAVFGSNQFGGIGISNNVTIVGDDGLDQFQLRLSSAGSFSAAGWTFVNWDNGAEILSLFGTSDADTITGSSQDDRFVGSGGLDHLSGGDGDDNFFVNASGFAAGSHFDGGAGSDDEMNFNVAGSFDLSTATLTGIERLFMFSNNGLTVTIGGDQIGGGGIGHLRGNFGTQALIINATSNVNLSGLSFDVWGSEDSITINGTAAANRLTGSSRNDTINGGGNADLMRGLGGNDTYSVDNASDRAVEAAGGGTDRVLASVSWMLEANFEVERIDTTNQAGTSAINLIGNAFNQTLIGNAGENTLNGLAGADNMRGFGGNDRYHVDHAGDRSIEAVGGGNDRVLTAVSYTLEAGSEIELFTTNSTAGTSAINLTGNAFANSILGNAGANIINGGGNADFMRGLGGNDIYYVDNASDRAVEAAGGGTDRVLTSVSWILEANSEVERIDTTNQAGTDAINLTGNAFNQTLIGNAGANTLDGRAGADVMRGFGGNDTYFVDNAADRAIEAEGKGFDTVRASIDFALEAGSEIDVLETTNQASLGAINLTGNALAQTINGNAGANILNGLGGDDALMGFGGNDIFRFTTALNATTNVDPIGDFNVVDDTIQLDDAVFVNLAAGALNPNAFRIGAAAADADDRVIYNSATGALIFDSNGDATGGATIFSALAAGLPLTNADFFVI